MRGRRYGRLLRGLRVVQIALSRLALALVPPEHIGARQRRPQWPTTGNPGFFDLGAVTPPPLVEPVHVCSIAAAESVPDEN